MSDLPPAVTQCFIPAIVEKLGGTDVRATVPAPNAVKVEWRAGGHNVAAQVSRTKDGNLGVVAFSVAVMGPDGAVASAARHYPLGGNPQQDMIIRALLPQGDVTAAMAAQLRSTVGVAAMEAVRCAGQSRNITLQGFDP